MSEDKVNLDPFVPTLESLDQSGSIYFLEGGQAVNLWTSFFHENLGPNSGFESYRPFTSKDCDVYVSMAAFRFFEKEPGKLHRSNSPADGQFAIYVVPGEQELHVDLMTCVYGIPMEKIPHVIKRVQKVRGLYVLDPIYLLKAKCHNLDGLPQGGRQDRKHVGMMACVVPAYFRLLGEELASENLTERQVIKELKFLITNCTKDTVVARTLAAENITLASLIPSEILSSQRHPTLQRFLESLSL